MKMLPRLALAALTLLALPVSQAAAGVWEVSPFARYTTAAKFDFTSSIPELAGYEINADDGFAFGAGIGYMTSPGFMFEAEYNYFGTDVTARPGITGIGTDIGDLTIHKIRGNFLFSGAYSESNTTPYFLLGMGAGIFDLKGAGSETKFSWQLGAGVKHMTSETMGIRLQAAYAPTYLNDSYGGYWCDPWYGCYTVPDPHYLDQWEFSAGIVKRFGTMYR